MAAPAGCTRCRRYYPYGHRDPDNHGWYCEDCWQDFCGPRRSCAQCRAAADKGFVDPGNQYWYCNQCWDKRPRPTSAIVPHGARPPDGSRMPPPGYPPPPSIPGHPAMPPHPLPMGYPPMGWYPPPVLYHPMSNGMHAAADATRSRSRSRSISGSRRERRRGGGKQRHFKPHHAKSVPKAEDLEAKAAAAGSEIPATTAMLRNIPNRYMQSGLLQEIDNQGFLGKYDFFYLPMDVHNKTNVGYAFINFLENADLERFCSHFENRQFDKHPSNKIATVSPAHIQGLDANLRHLAKKAVSQFKDKEYQPIVFRDGVVISFKDALRDVGAA